MLRNPHPASQARTCPIYFKGLAQKHILTTIMLSDAYYNQS